MSQVKKHSLIILFLLTFVSFFAVGCRNKNVAVKDIYFNLTEGEQIVLLVGQNLDMADYVEISPSNASNKGYTISSFDETIISVTGTTLQAVAEGNTQIKVVSHQNSLKEDLMTVVVKKNKTTLSAPKNLTYDSSTQMLKFDTVPNATSYTIKINETEIELGNSNVFDLTTYQGDIFNTLLSVQVKANAPSYTYALEDSLFCDEVKIFQAGSVSNTQIINGVLTFEKSSERLNSNIYISNKLLLGNTESVSANFNFLSKEYAGQNVQIGIEAVVGEEIKSEYGEDVKYFNSIIETVTLQVLDIPKLNLKTSIVEWQNIENAVGYEIFFNNSLIGETTNNFFDLSSWNEFNTNVTSNKVGEILVQPVLEENNVNIGKTSETATIKIKRLQTPTRLTCKGPNIEWNEIANASAYSFVLTGTNIQLQEESSTKSAYLSMKGYEAGKYEIKVQAIASEPDKDGVFYVSSEFASKKDIEKQSIVSAKIENYELIIDGIDLGTDSAFVEFENSDYDEIVTGDGQNKVIDLSPLSFEAGERKINVVRLGNNSNIVDSSDLILTFIQLEEIQEIVIKNSVAKVEISEINKNATIKFVTLDASGNKMFEVEGVAEFDYNTTDSTKETFLSVGSYVTKVYVIGDGKTTFSFNRDENSNAGCSASREFNVLKIPTLTLTNSAEEKMSIRKIENADSYDVSKNGEEWKTFTQCEFSFTLTEGSVEFAVQAIGNGTTYLNSAVSEAVTVTRLQTPTLSYDSNAEKLTITDLNEADTVEKCELKKDGVVTDMFVYTGDNRLLDDTTFTVQTIAKNLSEGAKQYFLNSDIEELRLTKILVTDTTIKLSENLKNQLIITANNHEDEYDLELVFSFGGTYQTENNVLTNGSVELPYSYDAESKTYVIDLINDNHNVRIEELKQEFSVQVKFNKPENLDKNLINSEFAESGELNIVKISNTTTIEINEDNQLVITPANHEEEYALVLELTNNGEMEFISNGEGKLVCGSIELPYSYSNNSYYVDLLTEDYSPLISTLSGEFSVRVQYRYYHNNTTSDLDSEFSDSRSFTILGKATISRNGHNLEITKINATHTYANYALVINDSEELLYLKKDEVVVDETTQDILINVDFIFNNRSELSPEDVNSVCVVTLNLRESSNADKILSSKSEPIYIQKAQALNLSFEKDNSGENNSAIVSFETYTADYNKTYRIEFSNGGTTKTFNYDESDADDGVISCVLDKLEELNEGKIKVRAYVSSEGNYSDGKTIEVFNSNKSNEIEIEKILAPTNLQISDSVLTFDAVDHAVGYEIYYLLDSTYTKLNTGIMQTNEYTFSNLNFGSHTICVKAISETNYYANSDLSEGVSVEKLSKPSVSIVDGKFHLDVTQLAGLFTDSSATITPIITNANRTDSPITISTSEFEEGVKLILTLTKSSANPIELEMTDLDFEGNTELGIALFAGYSITKYELVAEPYLFMAYNSESLSAEKLSVYYKITYNDATTTSSTYYLNSDPTEMNVYGLFAPTKVQKTVSTDGTYVERIEWTPSDKNKLGLNENGAIDDGETLEVSYIVKIEHTLGEETKVYYFDAGTSTSMAFPEGYGSVKFDEGSFKVSVQTILRNSIEGYNICGSKYSDVCEFDILSKVELKVQNGEVAWSGNAKASKYIVSVRAYGDENDKTNVVEYDGEGTVVFNFDSNGITGTGVYEVKVKAIGENLNVLNSKDSNVIYVYKLPEADSIMIDDGKLVLTSTGFFNVAEFEFVDDENNKKYKVPYDNSEIATGYVNSLSVETSWLDKINEDSNFEDLNKLINTSVTTVIDIDGIPSGRQYTINVTLIGNTNTICGIVSSSKTTTISSLTAERLYSPNASVESGTLKFDFADNYETVQFGYNFNGEDPTSAQNFWDNTIVYKIKLTHETKDENLNDVTSETYIYAVDYYSFMSAINEGWLTEADYVLTANPTNTHYATVYYTYETEKLCFNVYEDNKIDLRNYNYLTYYPLEETLTETTETDTGIGLKSFTTKWENADNELNHIDLTTGGSFTFALYMLGEDSYLTSGARNVKTFVRYANNSLTTSNGILKFNNLRPLDDDGNAIDNPLYKIEATAVNNLSGATTQVIYGYYSDDVSPENSKNIALEIAKKHYNGDISEEELKEYLMKYLQPVTVDGSVLYLDISSYLTGGESYNLTIQTLAGLGTTNEDSDYLLDAKESGKYIFHKLSDTYFNAVVDGALQFEQSYYNAENKTYCENYEITISYDGVDYVFDIESSSEGVKIDNINHKVTYALPNAITSKNGRELNIAEDVEYTIKIRALATDNNVISGTYNDDLTLIFKRTSGVGETLDVQDGKLTWNGDLGVYIRISYEDEEENIVYFKDEYASGTSYEFSDKNYEFKSSSGSLQITNKQPYSICIYVKGSGIVDDVAIINSNMSNVITVNRLAQVSDNIRTEDGILHWDAVEEAVSYEVNISGNSQIITIYDIENNFLDLSQYEEFNNKIGYGKSFSVKIKANGTNKLNGLTSNVISGFEQLSQVDYSSIKIEDGKIVWDAVDNATGYAIKFSYTNSAGESKFVEKICETNNFDPNDHISDGITGAFSIVVSAVGNGKFIKSKATDVFTASKERPQPVKSVKIENNRIKITVNEDFVTTDSLFIRFDMATYLSDGTLAETNNVPCSITYQQNGYYENGYYYYPLTIMAQYSNILVNVVRPGTLDSATLGYENELITDIGANKNYYDLHLFDYGAGTLDNSETTEDEYNPYRISSDEQLLNIKHFPSANYILISSLTLSGITSESLSSGALICDEFSGTLDGNGFTISFSNNAINFENVYQFALFGNLKGATIKNLEFADVTLLNSFANDAESVVKLSLIATGANNSIIQNVKITNFKVELSNTQYEKSIYIAGLIVDIMDTTIDTVKANFTVEINSSIDATATTYVGAIASTATNSTITKSTSTTDSTEKDITFTLTTSSTSIVTYVGGVVGRMEKGTIENLNVQIDVQDVNVQYLGGLAGYATGSLVSNCSTTGNYWNDNSINNQRQVYLGGLIGHATGTSTSKSTITNSTSNVEIGKAQSTEFTASSLTNQYYGQLVGCKDQYVEINNCSCDAEKDTTEIDDSGNVTIGKYGKQ